MAHSRPDTRGFPTAVANLPSRFTFPTSFAGRTLSLDSCTTSTSIPEAPPPRRRWERRRAASFGLCHRSGEFSRSPIRSRDAPSAIRRPHVGDFGTAQPRSRFALLARDLALTRAFSPFEPQGARVRLRRLRRLRPAVRGQALLQGRQRARGVAQPARAARGASSGSLRALYANGAVGGGAGDESSGPDPPRHPRSQPRHVGDRGRLPRRSATAPLIRGAGRTIPSTAATRARRPCSSSSSISSSRWAAHLPGGWPARGWAKAAARGWAA